MLYDKGRWYTRDLQPRTNYKEPRERGLLIFETSEKVLVYFVIFLHDYYCRVVAPIARARLTASSAVHVEWVLDMAPYYTYIVLGFEVCIYGVSSLESPRSYCCHCALLRSSCSRRKLSEKMHFEKLGGSVQSQNALKGEGGANCQHPVKGGDRAVFNTVYQVQGGKRKKHDFTRD